MYSGLTLNDTLPDTNLNLTSSSLTFTDTANSNTLTIDNTTITHFNNFNPFKISSNYVIEIETLTSVNIGDSNGAGNTTYIGVDDNSQQIILDSKGTVQLGDVNSSGNGVLMTIDDATSLISLVSPAINLDSDDLQFTNSNVVTVTQNHTSTLGTTSNISDITTYLKVKLNGNDIWIPYFTQDPSI
jgi:hypothetical protein